MDELYSFIHFVDELYSFIHLVDELHRCLPLLGEPNPNIYSLIYFSSLDFRFWYILQSIYWFRLFAWLHFGNSNVILSLTILVSTGSMCFSHPKYRSRDFRNFENFSCYVQYWKVIGMPEYPRSDGIQGLCPFNDSFRETSNILDWLSWGLVLAGWSSGWKQKNKFVQDKIHTLCRHSASGCCLQTPGTSWSPTSWALWSFKKAPHPDVLLVWLIFSGTRPGNLYSWCQTNDPLSWRTRC